MLQELALRYEALSLAVAQLSSSQQLLPAPSMQQRKMAFTPPAELGQLPIPQVPEQAPSLETIGEAAEALAGASETAHSAAETVLSSPDKVLKPSTSAGLYDSIGDAEEGEGAGAAAMHMQQEPPIPEHPPAQREPSGSVGPAEEAPHAVEEAGALHDDDRFLSLATGEAQADALDVGAPAQRPDQATGVLPAANGLPPQRTGAGAHVDIAAEPGHSAAAAEEVERGGAGTAEQEPRQGRMVALTEALQHRTSSTIATVGSSEEATIAGSDMSTVYEAAEGLAPENNSAHEGGGGKGAQHLPATSSDADPFHETDMGLKVVAAGQAQVRCPCT